MYGTHSVVDLQSYGNQTVVTYGEDRLFEEFNTLLDVHSQRLNDMTRELAENTADIQRRWGGSEEVEGIEGDEFSVPDAVKVSTTGDNIGFRLTAFQWALQWTKMYLAKKTVKDVSKTVDGILTNDIKKMRFRLRRALYTPTNDLTYLDRRGSGLTLQVRAFLNADGAKIPMNAQGLTFNGATHNHYMGTTALTANNLQALIDTVQEHHPGDIRVVINQGQEATVKGLTGFYGYTDSRLIVPTGGSIVTAQGNLDRLNVNNRAIGIFGSAEIVVKPWQLSNYMFAYNPTAKKPLVKRTQDGNDSRLQLIFEDDSYPLRSQMMEHEYDYSVQERTNGAFLYIGNASYVTPNDTLLNS